MIFAIRREMNIIRDYTILINKSSEELTLDYVLKLGDSYVVVMSTVLSIDELRKRADWVEDSAFCLCFLPYDIEYMDLLKRTALSFHERGMVTTEIPAALATMHRRRGTVNRNGYLCNVSAVTKRAKINSIEDHFHVPGYRVLSLRVKLKSDNFDDMLVCVNADNNQEIIYNEGSGRIVEAINGVEIVEHLSHEDEDIERLSSRLGIRVVNEFSHGAVPDIMSTLGRKCSVRSFNIGLVHNGAPWRANGTNPQVTVYIKADAGYLSKNKVHLGMDGVGTFKHCCFGLELDEVATIKFGFKYTSNVLSVKHVNQYVY